MNEKESKVFKSVIISGLVMHVPSLSAGNDADWFVCDDFESDNISCENKGKFRKITDPAVIKKLELELESQVPGEKIRVTIENEKKVRNFINWVGKSKSIPDELSYLEVVNYANKKGYEFSVADFKDVLRKMTKEDDLPKWVKDKIGTMAAYSRWPD